MKKPNKDTLIEIIGAIIFIALVVGLIILANNTCLAPTPLNYDTPSR
ncbi:MAG: hypothetical protein HDT42_08540 [Ruminococcaceae bacterium]|nr:hypothetical protein [Oscillospiraceae bacterium]